MLLSDSEVGVDVALVVAVFVVVVDCESDGVDVADADVFAGAKGLDAVIFCLF